VSPDVDRRPLHGTSFREKLSQVEREVLLDKKKRSFIFSEKSQSILLNSEEVIFLINQQLDQLEKRSGRKPDDIPEVSVDLSN
jgi:hypothetical protein